MFLLSTNISILPLNSHNCSIYNLKRHLTSLPPIPSQVYHDRIASIDEASASEDSTKNSSFHKLCTTCKKDFYTPRAYQNHLKSGNHRQAVTKLEAEDDVPVSDELEKIAFQIEKLGSFSCLFCSRSFSTFDLNMEHMQKTHNFSIPNQDSLFDLETFVEYLSTLITTFQECLSCGQTRDTAAAIRQHMVDKGHCSLAPDAAESSEFEDFYDISDSEDADEEDDDTEPETLNSTESNERHLPSGRTLIHRSQARQHRQHRTTTPAPSAQKALEDTPNASNPSSSTDRRAAMALTRTENANRGLAGVPELQKRAVLVLEKKMMKMEVRARNQYQARVEKQTNKQKFFKVSEIVVFG